MMMLPNKNQDSDSNNNSNNQSTCHHHHHVVIVGAGMAGLTCARELLLLQLRNHKHNQTSSTSTCSDQQPPPNNNHPTPTLHLSILEADDRIGGRVRRGNDNNNHNNNQEKKKNQEWMVDVGAEFIHGSGTLLTELMDELCRDGFWETGTDEGDEDNDEAVAASKKTDTSNNNNNNDNCCGFLEEIFVTAHADGGPDESPTRDGKYGMYFVDGKLRMYNDPYLQPLDTALQDILLSMKQADTTDMNHTDCNDDNTDDLSMMDALLQQKYNLPAPLLALAQASFANTAAGPLQDLSVHMLSHFERHWQQDEVAGDYRLRQPYALHSIIVDGLVAKIKQLAATAAAAAAAKHKGDSLSSSSSLLQIHTNSKVTSISSAASQEEQQQQQQQQTASSSTTDCNNKTTKQLNVTTADGTVYANVDAVVVTIPPPAFSHVTNLQQELLSKQQQEALTLTGFEPHMIKIVVLFDKCLWPAMVQSMVCANEEQQQQQLLIPEVWFRCQSTVGENESCWSATAFLASTAAQEFVEKIEREVKDKDEEDNSTHSRTKRFQQRAVQLFLQQLSTIFDIPLAEWQGALQEYCYYNWKDHPHIQGGYMYPKVGLTPQHLQALATPCKDANLFLAGEATNTNACCTIQAAMETGVRAARQVQGRLGWRTINNPTGKL